MDWYELVYLKSGKNRRKILEALEKGPLTPTEAAKLLNNHRSTVSAVLLQLQDHAFVECKTPENHKYRLYSLTKKAKQYLHEIKKQNR